MNASDITPTTFDWNLARMAHRDCLPHLRQNNVIYFVTFRLNDSIPRAKLQQLADRRDRWLKLHPPPHTDEQSNEFRRIWTLPMERQLDSGHGKCQFRIPACRDALEKTMKHADGTDYRLGQYIIMPNHVHVLVHVIYSHKLSEILQAWKSISARRINRIMGTHGTLWQPESFDHIIRGEGHWKKFAAYIRKNPAHLPHNTFTLGCGSLVLE